MGEETQPTTRSERLSARPGDRLVIHGHRLGAPGRDAEILEARGESGSPPYWVRWQDDGHESLVFPGSDAVVERFLPSRRRNSTWPA